MAGKREGHSEKRGKGRGHGREERYRGGGGWEKGRLAQKRWTMEGKIGRRDKVEGNERYVQRIMWMGLEDRCRGGSEREGKVGAEKVDGKLKVKIGGWERKMDT